MRQPDRRLLYYLPPLLTGAAAIFFTIISVWYADSVGYAFFHPHDISGVSYERVSSLAQIWESQVNHWLFTNGRFVCHYLVQVFCQLLPRGWYDILNGLVWIWLTFATARLAGVTRRRPERMPVVAALVWSACFLLPYDPAFQINYVWSSAANASLLLVFFSRQRLPVPLLMLSALLGFMAGEWNESFSIPIATAILIFVIRRRFRLTPVQWTSGLAYGIGTLVLCLAPGNFLRLQLVGSGGGTLISGVEQILPMLLFPAAYLCLKPWSRRSRAKAAEGNFPVVFFVIIVIMGYLLGTALKFSSGVRMTLCPTLGLVILMVRTAHPSRRAGTAVTLLLCLAAIAATPFRYSRISLLNEKYKLLRERYHQSADGVTVLPDRLYAPLYRETGLYRMPWIQVERCLDPSKPELRVYPESLSHINLEKDTNMCVPFMKQGWIMIQSKSRPADFVIEKTALPGFLNKRMADRKVDFSPASDVAVDSTDAVRVAVYINERPYILSSISIKQPDQ